MDRHEFLDMANRFKFIDRPELVASGVLAEKDSLNWMNYSIDPLRFLSRLDDDRAEKLWNLVGRNGRPPQEEDGS